MRIRFLSCRVLVVFALVPVACLADARSKHSPSEIYPGPWLEITQEVRDTLTLRKVSACNEAVGRQSSVDSGEYLLYCTQDEQFIGQAGSLSRRRKRCVVPAPFSMASRCLTATEVVTVAASCPL